MGRNLIIVAIRERMERVCLGFEELSGKIARWCVKEMMAISLVIQKGNLRSSNESVLQVFRLGCHGNAGQWMSKSPGYE